MFLGLAACLILGLMFSFVFQKLRLPGLVGYLLCGILIGPYCLDLIGGELLSISADIRRLALVIILTRAGLALDLKDLRAVGRPALLMCFVPAAFEIIGMTFAASWLLDMPLVTAALTGSVVAAVSPAVVVPKMLNLIDKGYGRDKSIPQLIMTGASVDDVFVIVVFTSLCGLSGGGSVSWLDFAFIPVSIITGIAVGVIIGTAVAKLFERFAASDTVRLLILLGVSCVFVYVEDTFDLPFSGLLAVMSMGAAIRKLSPDIASRLSGIFKKLWIPAELMLFILVGAAINPKDALTSGFAAIAAILVALVFRAAGVVCCVVKTKLNLKERLFCVVAYLPKATVQAAIGSVPLAMGLPYGAEILTVAVLAILITAPLGEVGIELCYKHWLTPPHSDRGEIAADTVDR